MGVFRIELRFLPMVGGTSGKWDTFFSCGSVFGITVHPPCTVHWSGYTGRHGGSKPVLRPDFGHILVLLSWVAIWWIPAPGQEALINIPARQPSLPSDKLTSFPSSDHSRYPYGGCDSRKVPFCIRMTAPLRIFLEMEMDSSWAKALIMLRNISLLITLVLIRSFSKNTVTSRFFSSRTAWMQSWAFRANRDTDLTRIRSIFPCLQSRISRRKSCPFLGAGSGNALICIDVHKLPVLMGLNKLGVVFDLGREGISLIRGITADTGVSSHPQLFCGLDRGGLNHPDFRHVPFLLFSDSSADHYRQGQHYHNIM